MVYLFVMIRNHPKNIHENGILMLLVPGNIDYLFIMFKVASWTSTWKELTSWLSDCFVISLCRLDLFVILSKKGRGIRLY